MVILYFKVVIQLYGLITPRRGLCYPLTKRSPVVEQLLLRNHFYCRVSLFCACAVLCAGCLAGPPSLQSVCAVLLCQSDHKMPVFSVYTATVFHWVGCIKLVLISYQGECQTCSFTNWHSASEELENTIWQKIIVQAGLKQPKPSVTDVKFTEAWTSRNSPGSYLWSISSETRIMSQTCIVSWSLVWRKSSRNNHQESCLKEFPLRLGSYESD